MPKEEDCVHTPTATVEELLHAQDIDPFFILGDKVRKARLNRQQRERSRAETTARNRNQRHLQLEVLQGR